MNSNSNLMHSQKGAALYISMIVLLLLTIIGLVAMRVAGVQQKMAGAYMNQHIAFQNAETASRKGEADINTALWSKSGYKADDETCGQDYSPLKWANDTSAASARKIRRIDKCFPSGSISMGGPVNSPKNATSNIYQITVKASDKPSSPGSTAVIDTVFIP